MKKIIFSLITAGALIVFAQAVSTEAQTVAGGWINVSDVTSFGVASSVSTQNFYNTQETKDKLCQMSGYDSHPGYEWATNQQKWDKCDDEYHVSWNGGSWQVTKCGGDSYLAAIYCQKAIPAPKPPTISWNLVPTGVGCDATYTIAATGADADGDLSLVSIDKDGEAFAYGDGGSGFSAVSGNSTFDKGPKTVTYTAWSVDEAGNRSATITHEVEIGNCAAPDACPNIEGLQESVPAGYTKNASTGLCEIPIVPATAPTISWNLVPTGAGCNVSYAIGATGSDAGGDLISVSIDKDGVPFAYGDGGDGTTGTTGNNTSDMGPKTVVYTAWAVDRSGNISTKISHEVRIDACTVIPPTPPAILGPAIVLPDDACPNITGYQTAIPTGYSKDSSGNCVLPNRDPSGSFSATCSALSGTVADPDAPGQPIGVHVYVDGPAGSGALLGAVSTNSLGAYSLSVPESLKTNTDRTLYAYAINTPQGNNPQIGSATIKCAPQAVPSSPVPSGSISVSPTTVASGGGDVTVSWSVLNATSCIASGGWEGTKPAGGSEIKRVSSNSSFTLSCTGPGGNWSQTASVSVRGTLRITDFFISPSTVKTGDSFTVFAVSEWNGFDYLKRHRAYFAGSYGEKAWTSAGGPFATVLTTAGSVFTAERNQYSMRDGAGNTYSIVYEVEDNANNFVSASRTLTYLADAPALCVNSTKTYTCSASYGGFDFAHQQSSSSQTVYQSCSISESAFTALNIPPGTATLVSRDPSDNCPQCWNDTHAYGGTSWSCSRSMGGFDYNYFKGTQSITYYTSCDITPAQIAAYETQGYVYASNVRTNDGPGEWTDVHTMASCAPGTSSSTQTCNDPAASNHGGYGQCSYPSQCDDGSATNYGDYADCEYAPENPSVVNPGNAVTVPDNSAGGNGGGGGGNGGGASVINPGFTLSASSSTVRVRSVAGYSGMTEQNIVLRVNPVNQFEVPVAVSVSAFPADVGAEFSFDGGVTFTQSTNAPNIEPPHNGTIPVKIRFTEKLQEGTNYTVTFRGVGVGVGRGVGLVAETTVILDSRPAFPEYREI